MSVAYYMHVVVFVKENTSKHHLHGWFLASGPCAPCYTDDMLDFPPLSVSLPRLWGVIQTISTGLETGHYHDWPLLLAELDFVTESDWIETLDECLPGWRKIATIKSGITAKHTLIVLALGLNLPEYAALAENTRREFEWAALLHDLDKEYLPTGGKDASHAFRSAGVAAIVMAALGFRLQPGASPEAVAEWAEVVMAAQVQIGASRVHDHANLPEIVSGLERLWGNGTSASRILKAILFHQSLPTIKDWTNPVLLDDAELRDALTLSDMDVLGPLLIADSDAWNLFDEPRLAYLNELRENIAATRQKLTGEHKIDRG